MDFWWMLALCWAPKIHPKSIKNRFKNHFKKWLVFWLILCWFMLIFIGFWGAKRGGLEGGRRHFFRSWGQDGPKSPQEPTKTPPRGSQEPPKSLQEPSKMALGTDFWSIFDRFWMYCWWIFGWFLIVVLIDFWYVFWMLCCFFFAWCLIQQFQARWRTGPQGN